MTRRALIGTGAVVVGAGGLLVAAEATGRLDDVADAVGIDPKPQPDPDDTRVLRRAARATAELQAAVAATSAGHPGLDLAAVTAAVGEQLAALGGAEAPAGAAPPADQGAAVDALAQALDIACKDRARDAVTAGSPALVRVLAAMSAGHAQSARVVRSLR
ncbi:hypothetical protein DX116_11415 [Aeromicrobium endophyticum]|uniref:Uncharacterized protein n=2 Tax=Aeromicrobium endophyticum TaxID=2292704 RepID=A0A371P1N7_9ACTN|nr:hypothetical protein DX116_11415 [Aeromicrobium endophyticum]